MKLKWPLCLFVVLFSLLVSGCSGEESSGENGEHEEAETEEIAEGEVALKEIEFLGGAISVSIPEDFYSMEDELVEIGYPTGDIPDAIYTNAEGTANITFKHDDLLLAPDEIDDYIEAMTKLLNSSDTLILLSSGVNEVDGQDVGYLNIVTEQEGKQIYNSVWVASLDGTALFGSFNCYDDVAVEMKPIAEDVYKSIQFN